jgi:PadR family transcriptional regulator PadR
VLALVAKGDTYGYSLTQEAKRTLDISESTLYPVMRRLQTEGYLDTYDKPHNGRNRRYYQITAKGVNELQTHQANWQVFKQKIDKIIGGNV